VERQKQDQSHPDHQRIYSVDDDGEIFEGIYNDSNLKKADDKEKNLRIGIIGDAYMQGDIDSKQYLQEINSINNQQKK